LVQNIGWESLEGWEPGDQGRAAGGCWHSGHSGQQWEVAETMVSSSALRTPGLSRRGQLIVGEAEEYKLWIDLTLLPGYMTWQLQGHVKSV
jgi:hypothetical protein